MRRRGSVIRDAERGTWTVVVDVTPAGAGARKQVRRRGFPTKAAALEVLRELVDQGEKGTYTPPSRLTFGEYLEGWLGRLPVEGLAESTIANYRRLVRVYLRPRLGDVRLGELTPVMFDDLYAELTGRGLSARTVRLVHTTASKALSAAERQRQIPTNPARSATPPRAAAAKRKQLTVWTAEELRRVLEVIDPGDGMHVAVAVMAMTGLRRGEAVGLRWDDVDLEGGRLTVRRSIVAVDGQDIERDDTKTGTSRRVVDLGPETVARLRRWRSTQNEYRLRMGAGWQGRGQVFTTATGEVLDLRSFGRRLGTLARRAGVPVIRVHDLRHTHATLMLAAGANPRTVADRLGHTSVAFTLDVYAHVLPTQQADAAAALEALIGA
jgi:integrase